MQCHTTNIAFHFKQRRLLKKKQKVIKVEREWERTNDWWFCHQTLSQFCQNYNNNNNKIVERTLLRFDRKLIFRLHASLGVQWNIEMIVSSIYSYIFLYVRACVCFFDVIYCVCLRQQLNRERHRLLISWTGATEMKLKTENIHASANKTRNDSI